MVIGRLWRWEGGLLAGYAFLILAETVLIRKASPGSHFRPELFWSWREWSVQRVQILTNIVMIIPVGLLAGKLWRWIGLELSAVVEVLQVLTSRGLCEFDDAFHNMIGAAVGVGIVMITNQQ